jgi:hypothetical protein
MAKSASMRWSERIVALVMLGGPLWLFIVGPAVDDFRGARAGRRDARSELAAGHLRIQIGGKWTELKHKVADIAVERYGIEVVNTGCVPNDYKTGYSRTYNQEMQQAIDQRFSNVSFETIFQEVEQQEALAKQ